VAGEIGFGEFAVGREGEAEFFVDAGELVRLRVEHHGERGVREAGEEFLAFAEAVSEKYGRGVLGEGGAAEGDDVGDGFFGGREDILRAAEGGLHNEGVGAGRGVGAGGEAGAGFEIAGVEEGAAFGVIEEDLGGAVDVAGGEEGDGGVGGELFGVAEGKEVFAAAGGGETFAHEAGGGGGAEDFAVAGDVIGVSVGDEGAVDGAVGVERPADLREVDAVAELDVPRRHIRVKEGSGCAESCGARTGERESL
jgi:hypothetical protein